MGPRLDSQSLESDPRIYDANTRLFKNKFALNDILVAKSVVHMFIMANTMTVWEVVCKVGCHEAAPLSDLLLCVTMGTICYNLAISTLNVNKTISRTGRKAFHRGLDDDTPRSVSERGKKITEENLFPLRTLFYLAIGCLFVKSETLSGWIFSNRTL